jgi:hypothetical protein
VPALPETRIANRFKDQYCLRELPPQSGFVAANQIKHSLIEIAETKEADRYFEWVSCIGSGGLGC